LPPNPASGQEFFIYASVSCTVQVVSSDGTYISQAAPANSSRQITLSGGQKVKYIYLTRGYTGWGAFI
jgi:hypothetical protein